MDFTRLELVSPRLILKSYTDKDATEVFAAVTPSLCRHLAFDPQPDLESFRATVSGWNAEMAAGRMAVFAIRRAEDGVFLGLTGLHDIQEGAPESGIWVKEAAHRQGFGREAVGRVVAWAGDELGFDHVYYSAAIENLASRRLVESLGGREIGRTTIRKLSGVELPSIRYRLSALP